MLDPPLTQPDTTRIFAGQPPDTGADTTWHREALAMEEPTMDCEHCREPIVQEEPYVSYNRQVEMVSPDGCVEVLDHEELDRLHLSCDETCQHFHTTNNREEIDHVEGQ